MFSPLNNSNVTNWFRRLDAAWRRMPADEQARQREEVQQHLEGLVAAKATNGQSPEDAWNAALMQFGDPVQLGRKLYREWKQSRTGFGPDMTAISFVFICGVLLFFAASVSRFLDGHRTYYLLSAVVSLGWMVPAVVGLLYPMQAIKGSLYGQCFVFCCIWTFFCASGPIDLSRSMAFVLPSFALRVIEHAAVAYFASVTKRGWYRPTWKDFKLMWPKRRQAG